MSTETERIVDRVMERHQIPTKVYMFEHVLLKRDWITIAIAIGLLAASWGILFFVLWALWRIL